MQKMKIFNFETKNVLFGYFWATTIVIFESSTLDFVKNEFGTHAVNFGIGFVFSKGPGSAFSESLGPEPGLI